MENPNNIKRSIRIPKEIHKKLEVMAKRSGISVNKKIIEIIREKIGR